MFVNPLWRKRLTRLLWTIIAGVITLCTLQILDRALLSAAHFSGWFLFAVVVFLALLSMRKRIRFFPVGSAEFWLQVHIYLGLFSGMLFLLHVGWKIPRGLLDCILATVFLATFLSGVFGIFISRALASRLTTRGNETLYQHIQPRMNELHEEVKSEIVSATEKNDSSAIAQFYSDDLQDFFSGPKNFFQHVIQSDRPIKRILNSVGGFERYLSSSERDSMSVIVDKIQQKNELDYKYSLQSALKLWLFVHVPMTYSLIVFAVTHCALVVAYAGVEL